MACRGRGSTIWSHSRICKWVACECFVPSPLVRVKIYSMVTLQLKVVDGPPVDVNPIAAFSPSLLFPILIRNVSATRLNLTLMPPTCFHSLGIRMPTSTLALGLDYRNDSKCTTNCTRLISFVNIYLHHILIFPNHIQAPSKQGRYWEFIPDA